MNLALVPFILAGAGRAKTQSYHDDDDRRTAGLLN